MERKLRFLEKEIKKDDIPMMDSGDSPEAPQPREMIDLEATFEKLEHELQEVNQNAEALKKNFLELTELKHILRKTQQFFEEQDQLEGMIIYVCKVLPTVHRQLFWNLSFEKVAFFVNCLQELST